MSNTLVGNYELIKEIGRGGMGIVYLAQDLRLNRKVAIKELSVSGQVLSDELENIVLRFQREAQAASKLQHPNIVTVYDYLLAGEHHYMVMEYLEGKSLQHYIDLRQAFNIEQTVDIGAQVCAALDYAHAHQIVHRDIKPDNILLLDNGRIKLMDFGVARHVGEVSKLTQAGTTLGTIAYISPEQLCDSRLVDGRSDIFSLGAMLYEMLTLRTPFDAGNVGGTIMKIMSEDPVPPRQMNPAIPARLEAVIMRALRKSADERFPKASEMGQALVNAIRTDAASPTRNVQLNVMTCRGCGTGIPGGRGPCPKCGRLQAPSPQQTSPGAAPPPPGQGMGTGSMQGAPMGAPQRPQGGPGSQPQGPRPMAAGTGQIGGTGQFNERGPQQGAPGAPRGTGGLNPAQAPQRPGFPPNRPGGGSPTGGLSRTGRPITGARLLFTFGAPGFNPGEFQQPRGMTIDSNRQLYVADTENSRVQIFDPQGNFQREIKPQAGRESFRFPRSVAISPTTGRIYVVDELDFRIYVFDGEGKQVAVWDRRRNQSDPSAIPGRLAISPNGNIYVSEPNSHRVMMYTATHGFTATFGGNGELQSPSGLAVGPKGAMYVLDYGQCRVHTYDNKGKAATPFGRRGAGPGEFSVPRDIAVDKSGNVFVADTLNHRVQVFDPAGELMLAFGQKGKGDGQFAGPEGLALSNDDILYVSDRGNGRVQVFQIDRG